MPSIGKTKNIMLGMAFAVVSLASVSVFIDWSARGQAALSAWDEMAGLFAFGYHPVSASEWAALNSTVEPICPESDLPGRQLLAASRPAVAQSKPYIILKAKIVPARQRICKEKAPTVIAAVSKESDESPDPVVSDSDASDFELPVYSVDFAELASYEQAAEVEEFTARASEIAESEIDLRFILQAHEYGVRARTAFKLTPVFVVEKPTGWIDLILKMRLRKDAVTPAPVTCGP